MTDKDSDNDGISYWAEKLLSGFDPENDGSFLTQSTSFFPGA